MLKLHLMRKFFVLFTGALCLSACNFFEQEKMSSKEIYEEEVKSIDWADVDVYPLFENCKEEPDQNPRNDCFSRTIREYIFNEIQNQHFVASETITDTVFIVLDISERGKIHVSDIEMDSLSEKEFPQLKQLITKKIQSLQLTEPAYKRGIPVKTRFMLPVIIQTD